MPLYGAAAEYAMHTVLNLALVAEGSAPSARDLAEFQRLPVAFMRKLLTRLEKSGIVAASEGIRGGWRLTRAPVAISLLDLADATQGREKLFVCREIRAHCALWPEGTVRPSATRGICAIHAAMLAAEAAMRRELAGQSLGGIIDELRAQNPAFTGQALPAWFACRIATRRPTDPPEPEADER